VKTEPIGFGFKSEAPRNFASLTARRGGKRFLRVQLCVQEPKTMNVTIKGRLGLSLVGTASVKIESNGEKIYWAGSEKEGFM